MGGAGSLAHLVLPAVTLALPSVAMVARMTRSACSTCCARTTCAPRGPRAWASAGCSASHALRNAFIPILTLLGLQAGQLMGGAVLTETVFAWPGLGRLMVKAIFARDYVLLQGAVLVFALAFVLINLLVDLSYGAARPARGAAGLAMAFAAERSRPAVAWRADGRLGPLPPQSPRAGRARPGRRARCSARPLAPVAGALRSRAQSLIEKRAQPGGKYLLGADEFGRDILSRVIYGIARGAAGGRALGRDRAGSAGSCSACLAGFARRLARRAR